MKGGHGERDRGRREDSVREREKGGEALNTDLWYTLKSILI